jgi:hypothetical protein
MWPGCCWPARPALARLAHIRAVLAVRLSLEAAALPRTLPILQTPHVRDHPHLTPLLGRRLAEQLEWHGLVPHIHREVIHHGVEIALLRDVYLHQK